NWGHWSADDAAEAFLCGMVQGALFEVGGELLGGVLRAARGEEELASAGRALKGARCNLFNSFSADTPVETDHGDVPISTLQVGDQVLAYDEASATTGYYPITAVIVHTDTQMLRLT